MKLIIFLLSINFCFSQSLLIIETPLEILTIELAYNSNSDHICSEIESIITKESDQSLVNILIIKRAKIPLFRPRLTIEFSYQKERSGSSFWNYFIHYKLPTQIINSQDTTYQDISIFSENNGGYTDSDDHITSSLQSSYRKFLIYYFKRIHK